MASLGLNGWFKQFGAAFNAAGNFDRLTYLRARLEKVPFPPKLRHYLDCLCGVFGVTDDDMWIIAMVNNAATRTNVTDFTSSSAIATLLTRAETLLPDVEATGTVEANVINQVMAMVYGPPQPFQPKSFYTDPTWFDMHYMQLGMYRDTQANLTYHAPLSTGTAGAPGIVPIPVRYGASAPHLLSIIRPQVYSVSASINPAHASPVGLLTYSGDTGDFVRHYFADDATTSIVVNDGNTASLVAFNPTTDVYGHWWVELAIIGGTGLWQNDSRRYDRWDEYYIGTDRMGAATRKALDQMILVDVNIRPLR